MLKYDFLCQRNHLLSSFFRFFDISYKNHRDRIKFIAWAACVQTGFVVSTRFDRLSTSVDLLLIEFL